MRSFDCETFEDQKKIIPFLACFNFGSTFYSIYYEEGEDVILKAIYKIFELLNEGEKSIFYIHNINFDGALIINSISKSNFEFNCFINNMDIFYVKITFFSKEILFKCSYKILPISLKSIGLLFEIGSKINFPHAFSKKKNLFYIGNCPNEQYFSNYEDFLFFKNKNIFDFKKEITSYCLNDVSLTCLAMERINKICSNYGMHLNKVLSCPSLSLKIFLNLFNSFNIETNVSLKIDSFVRPSYHGGRCEVYGNPYNGEYIYHYDFVGMYGQIMLEDFGIGKCSYLFDVKNINFDFFGFYWIEWEVGYIEIPVLPLKNSKKDKLLFPIGEGMGCYWSEEIKLFLDNGGKIKKIPYGIIFNEKGKVFESFVREFNKIRLLGGAFKTFGKLMINSLYGRLGMNEIENFSFFGDNNLLELLFAKSINVLRVRKINSIFFIEAEICTNLKKILKIKKKKIKSNILLASAITSKARIKLYKAQKEVSDGGGRILYCDTDSIYAAFLSNNDNKTFGEVFFDCSKKNTKIKDAVFISPKTYAVVLEESQEVKIKGIKRDSVDFLKLKNDFYNNLNELVFYNSKFLKKQSFDLEFHQNEKIIQLQNYNKRIFSDDKKKTSPLLKTRDLSDS